MAALDPAVLHQTRKLAAIEAVSQGRFVDAQAILAILIEEAEAIDAAEPRRVAITAERWP